MPGRGRATQRSTSGCELRFSKWDGSTSKVIPLEPSGCDRYGQWFRWPAGTWMTRRSGPPVRHDDDRVVLVPREGSWIARWSPDGEYELYCDVTTRPVVTGSVIRAVDLDLDVVKFRGGRVALVDTEQFEQRRVELGYPPELVDAAVATARWLVEAVRGQGEPFASALAARHRR